MRSRGSDQRIARELTPDRRSLVVGKVCHARMDGNSDQCDRLRRLHCRRDLSQIAGREIAGPLKVAAVT